MVTTTVTTTSRLPAAAHFAAATAAPAAQQPGLGAIHQRDDEQRHGDRRESKKLLHISLPKETETENPADAASTLRAQCSRYPQIRLQNR
jgi:hypothetical protein